MSFGISSGSANSYASKTVKKLVHCHAHAELLCNISLYGKRTQCPIVLFCSFGLNLMCWLHLLGYHQIK